jgi:3-hydroxyacyl-[acyl-carrier-protein] dehydratase
MSFEIQKAAELIPQKPPFVLVDKLLFADEKKSCCNFTIPEENIFVDQGYYSTPGYGGIDGANGCRGNRISV